MCDAFDLHKQLGTTDVGNGVVLGGGGVVALHIFFDRDDILCSFYVDVEKVVFCTVVLCRDIFFGYKVVHDFHSLGGLLYGVVAGAAVLTFYGGCSRDVYGVVEYAGTFKFGRAFLM